jgi:hypothetical protein
MKMDGAVHDPLVRRRLMILPDPRELRKHRSLLLLKYENMTLEGRSLMAQRERSAHAPVQADAATRHHRVRLHPDIDPDDGSDLLPH